MPVKYLVVILSVTACCGYGESRKALQKRASAGDVSATETLAKRGIASSQYQLGAMYARGDGVPEDQAAAIKWYRLAAEQGNPDGQRMLAEMYANGRGVKQDDAEAVKWWQMSATQGDPDSIYKLGLLFNTGVGMPRDYIEAYAYFSVASTLGHPDAANARDLRGNRFTPEQKSQAKKRSAALLREFVRQR